MRPRSHQRIGAGLIGDELTRAALLARKAYQPASSSNPEPKSSPGVPTMWFAGASQELYIPYTITRRAWQRSPPQGLYRRFTQSKRRRDTATFCSASSFFLQAGAAAHGRKVKRGKKKGYWNEHSNNQINWACPCHLDVRWSFSTAYPRSSNCQG